MEHVRAASVQIEHANNDKTGNLRKIRGFVMQAAGERADLVAFPECCITGYWFLRHLGREALVDLAEPVPEGASSKEIIALAREFQLTIGAGLVELAPDGKLYNTYLVAEPDGSTHRHRKIHCFISEHLACGSEFTVFDSRLGKLGVLICYDNNIGENVRLTALAGAEILLAPHQTGGCDSVSPHGMKLVDRRLWDNRQGDPAAIEAELAGPKGRGWLMRWLPARAHDNGMFLVFSNGVGIDDDEIRTGNAMILDPYGRILAETCKADDDMVVADLDGSLLENCTGRRWMASRRPDLYKPLTIPTGKERSTRKLRFNLPDD